MNLSRLLLKPSTPVATSITCHMSRHCSLQNALKYEDGIEEPPSGMRKERRKGDESRRGRRSLGHIVAQEGGPGSKAAEDFQPSPAQALASDEEKNEGQ